MGGRALKPFYTEIGHGLSMGSLPFSCDVATLHGQYKVRAVVNMCRESEGPVSEYRQRGIAQLRLPTPDLCSPSVFDLIVGVRFMTQQRKQLAAEETIFVHCKGGRGRAATMVLCYLISQGWDAHEAILHLHGKRSVVATAVLEYPAVRHFVALQKSGELDTLLRATDETLREWEAQHAHLDPHSVWRDSYTMDRGLQRKKAD
jgi:atypical dual specificity phosphatase